MTVERGTAAGILTPERAAEWAARRARRDDPLLRGIWRRFIEAGGPVTLRAASGALPGLAPEIVRARAVALDAADLIGLDGDRVRLAYPFTTGPNEFEVVLPGGRVRYACCAIDALGVAPMIGRAVRLRARCHRSGAPLAFEVDPVAGPRDDPPGSLAWVERGRWGGDRLSGFLWTRLNFFRSEEELEAWRRETPDGDGAGLVLSEAFELGRRMFGGLLHAAPAD